MAENRPQPDLFRTTLAVLSIVGLIVATAWVMQPFLPALVWATTIVVATWPAFLRLERRLGGKRGRATAVMVVIFLVVFLGPVALAAGSLAANADDIVAWMRQFAADPPELPKWLDRFPVLSKKLHERWDTFTAANREQIAERLAPYAREGLRWAVEQAGSLGRLIVHLLLTAAIAGLLYARGETAGAGVRRFAVRLAGERGSHTVDLIGSAIRAVAMGVVVAATVQAALAGLGLAVAGIPHAGLFAAAALLLSLVQVGPTPVLIPAAIWLFAKDHTATGIAFVVWSVLIMGVDNVLRPFLIRRGADLPLILILTGVVGGLLWLGLIGLFLGPVVLSVAYTLTAAWIEEGEPPPEPAAAPDGPR